MVNLFEQMNNNRNEIIKLMEEKNQFEISFENVDEYDMPYILINDGLGEFIEITITAAKLVNNDGKKYIDFYSSDLQWIDEDDALSTTANNVYMTMYKCLTE